MRLNCTNVLITHILLVYSFPVAAPSTNLANYPTVHIPLLINKVFEMLSIHCLGAFVSIFWLVVTDSSLGTPSPVRTVYEFPNETWVENIAVRSNGNLLLTLLDRPELHLLDPFHPNNTTLIHVFPDVLGLLGIAEVEEDQFAVIAGNWSDTTDATIPGSYSIWEVNMRPFLALGNEVTRPAIVRKVTDMPDATFLNGMTLLNQVERTVLISDSGLGLVWKLDIDTKKYEVAIQDATMAAGPPFNLGINGIHLRDGYIYYTNSAQELFVRIPIHSDGTSTGAAEALVRDHFGDDFTFDSAGNAYVTEDTGNILYKVSPNGAAETLLGSSDSPLVAGCTSAHFGRLPEDSDVLYITTNGGIANPIAGIVGGKVIGFRINR